MIKQDNFYLQIESILFLQEIVKKIVFFLKILKSKKLEIIKNKYIISLIKNINLRKN